MNDNISRGKMSFVHSHSINWVHLAEKIPDQDLRSLQYLDFEDQNHVMLTKLCREELQYTTSSFFLFLKKARWD